MQRNFGACENQTFPFAVHHIGGAQALQLFLSLRCKPFHGTFDHAVDALKVAPEFHRHGDVLLMIEAAHTNLNLCERRDVKARRSMRS